MPIGIAKLSALICFLNASALPASIAHLFKVLSNNEDACKFLHLSYFCVALRCGGWIKGEVPINKT